MEAVAGLSEYCTLLDLEKEAPRRDCDGAYYSQYGTHYLMRCCLYRQMSSTHPHQMRHQTATMLLTPNAEGAAVEVVEVAGQLRVLASFADQMSSSAHLKVKAIVLWALFPLFSVVKQ